MSAMSGKGIGNYLFIMTRAGAAGKRKPGRMGGLASSSASVFRTNAPRSGLPHRPAPLATMTSVGERGYLGRTTVGHSTQKQEIMAIPPKSKPMPAAVPRQRETVSPQRTTNPRATEDLRWQRNVRFNWDKGGSRGGRK